MDVQFLFAEMNIVKYILIIMVQLNQTAGIIGGFPLATESFWGYVSLQRNGKNICGGILIGTKVITAAHCLIYESFSNICMKIKRIAADEHTDICENVTKVVIHPKYDEISSENDIAVINLDSINPLFEPELYSLPVVLPILGYKANGICIVIGYGTQSVIGPPNTSLYSAILPVVNLQQCRLQLGTILAPQPDSSLFCAGGLGPDACTGDSGSPLLCLSSDRTSWVFAGIVSYGMGCGAEGIPGVYTQISTFVNWFNENLM